MDWQVYDFLLYDYSEPRYFLVLFSVLLTILLARYFGLSWLYHRYIKQSGSGSRHLVKNEISRKQKKREVRWSLISSVIFALFTVLIVVGWQKGYLKVYHDINEYSLLMLPVSLVSILLLHETYYYWLHRWMHHPKVFRLVHKVHHDSIHTSSYTAFSFHPIESFLQALFLPLILLIVPTYLYMFIGLLVLMSISATINHAGVEVYPSGRFGRWMGRWFVGATHHHVHHTRFRYNYGLYFTFWDKIVGTENEAFSSEFRSITQPPAFSQTTLSKRGTQIHTTSLQKEHPRT